MQYGKTCNLGKTQMEKWSYDLKFYNGRSADAVKAVASCSGEIRILRETCDRESVFKRHKDDKYPIQSLRPLNHFCTVRIVLS